MAIAHYQFEAIHPFRDGKWPSRRRIYILNYLTNKKLLDYPILILSRFILDNKDDYYFGLNSVSQKRELEVLDTFHVKSN